MLGHQENILGEKRHSGERVLFPRTKKEGEKSLNQVDRIEGFVLGQKWDEYSEAMRLDIELTLFEASQEIQTVLLNSDGRESQHIRTLKKVLFLCDVLEIEYDIDPKVLKVVESIKMHLLETAKEMNDGSIDTTKIDAVMNKSISDIEKVQQTLEVKITEQKRFKGEPQKSDSPEPEEEITLESLGIS